MVLPPESNSETAGVVARPPLLFLSALLLGLVLDWLLPLPFPAVASQEGRWIAGGLIILAGLAVAIAAFRAFSRAGTPVPTNEPTRALVTSGVHGWSRNPIYVGLFLVYGGIAIAAGSTWMLIAAVPVALVMRYGVVAREEVYLERLFGDAYVEYKTRVRRWL